MAQLWEMGLCTKISLRILCSSGRGFPNGHWSIPLSFNSSQVPIDYLWDVGVHSPLYCDMSIDGHGWEDHKPRLPFPNLEDLAGACTAALLCHLLRFQSFWNYINKTFLLAHLIKEMIHSFVPNQLWDFQQLSNSVLLINKFLIYHKYKWMHLITTFTSTKESLF